ncbi:MAG: sulfatase-like hydrolase/transferase [bacterium]|nr:sulfatase-like hydrolase/transferase [bacterium]
MTRRLIFAICLTVLTLTASCGSGPDGSSTPNILLITLDTTRTDHMSVYGHAHRTTPFLEEFAREGTVFLEAYSSAPATAPSHATLFTSLSPLTHRVVKNAITLGEHQVTLAEMLRDRGYRTAAVLSSFVMNAKFGLDQGFDHYDDDLPALGSSIRQVEWEGEKVIGGFDRRATETTDRAVDWLTNERPADAPFFLFVHYFDPHDPYKPPPPYRSRFVDKSITKRFERRINSLYDGEIAYTDDQLRRLFASLDSLGLADDTLVIITGDHGEGLMQRGYQFHGAHIYDEAVRVPLLLRWPGRVVSGARIAGAVTIADVVPTIHDLLGWKAERLLFQGRSLAPALGAGGSPPADLPVFLYRIPYDPHEELGVWVDGEKHAVRFGKWKYLVSESEETVELYDLDADPGELVDVADLHPDRTSELAAMLADWRAAVTRDDSLAIQPELSESEIQKLRALGYTQ